MTGRASFDIRAFVIFEEKIHTASDLDNDEDVSLNNDRFRPDRLRPMLSFEESGCFCDDQAAKRRLLSTAD